MKRVTDQAENLLMEEIEDLKEQLRNSPTSTWEHP